MKDFNKTERKSRKDKKEKKESKSKKDKKQRKNKKASSEKGSDLSKDKDNIRDQSAQEIASNGTKSLSALLVQNDDDIDEGVASLFTVTKVDPFAVVKKRQADIESKIEKDPLVRSAHAKKEAVKEARDDAENEDADVDVVGDAIDELKAAKKPWMARSEASEKRQVDPNRIHRTLFVGNVALNTRSKHLISLFERQGECGKVESVRFRSIPIAQPKIPRLVALQSREFHEKRSSMNAYVVFMEQESVTKAIELFQGHEFKDKHLRLDYAAGHSNSDRSKSDTDGSGQSKLPIASKQLNPKSVFVGNLPLDAEEEDLRTLFAEATKSMVRDARVIRDRKLGIGKGFGYVTFNDAVSVAAASALHLQLKYKGRPLRVFRVNAELANASAKARESAAKKGNKIKTTTVTKTSAPAAGSKNSTATSMMDEDVRAAKKVIRTARRAALKAGKTEAEAAAAAEQAKKELKSSLKSATKAALKRKARTEADAKRLTAEAVKRRIERRMHKDRFNHRAGVTKPGKSGKKKSGGRATKTQLAWGQTSRASGQQLKKVARQEKRLKKRNLATVTTTAAGEGGKSKNKKASSKKHKN
eukprot:Clim_evm114s109 gene=Clim_evmTU114s109